MTAVLAGAGAVLGGLAGWRLAVRRWPGLPAGGLWWRGLSWWRKIMMSTACTGAGALAGLAWNLAPAGVIAAVVVLAGSEAVFRAVRAAAARREE